MWFLERGGELDLPAESCSREIVGELRRQDLHDDVPAEGFVASEEHAGHPTRAQLPLHRIVAAERVLELIEEIVQGFLGASSLMYAGRDRSSYAGPSTRASRETRSRRCCSYSCRPGGSHHNVENAFETVSYGADRRDRNGSPRRPWRRARRRPTTRHD